MNKQEIETAVEELQRDKVAFEKSNHGGFDNKIKAFDLAISAIEKQRPKKPILYGDIEDGKLLCPNCEEDLWDIKDCGFSGCPYCLQAIDWGNEDE